MAIARSHSESGQRGFCLLKGLQQVSGLLLNPSISTTLGPSGLEKAPVRKFGLQNQQLHDMRLDEAPGGVVRAATTTRRSTSSIYPIVPLPPSSTTGGSDGDVFLSGAYDSIVRLHDLRSSRDVEQAYTDPTDDSSIYSLLPRGQETLVAGTSRHSLVKFFDLRMGAKCYDYLNIWPVADKAVSANRQKTRDWNLFLKPTGATYPGRGGGNNWSRRSQESSVYSLASSSPCSPHIYAGVESAVVDLAFTSVLDHHPDPVYFHPWKPAAKGKDDNWRSREVLDLAMYNQTTDMKLFTQRSLWSTWRSSENPVGRTFRVS